MQSINNSNEWINWIEEAISEKHIKRYEFASADIFVIESM